MTGGGAEEPGGAPGMVAPGSRGAGATLGVDEVDIRRSSSGTVPSISRSRRIHGRLTAVRSIVTRRGQSASRPATSTRLM